MEIFGITIGRTKALYLSAVRSGSSWWSTIRESFTGAWQRNVECESPKNILAFSAVYACISLISDDIAKLRIKLVERQASGIWTETESPAFSPVLRKPNRYQTRIQFLSQWITSKLLYGNAYIWKDRDQRGVVTSLFVLDPKLVVPLVGEDGSVYYELKHDALSGLASEQSITVPASEIIHDRMLTLWHPLIGVSPIYACGSSATQGIRIQSNSANFFAGQSRPSLHIGAPGKIDEITAKRIKESVEAAVSGANIGRVLVTGDDMKVTPMTIPAVEAQLIEQLRWTVEDVARCFHVPLHKLGMGQPTLNNIGALNQDYYTQTLQTLIESVELLLDEGLALPRNLGTELDLEGLLRMDPLSRADTAEKLVRASVWAPDEARLTFNLGPVEGGNSPMAQQQNYSLAALAKRDAQPDPFASTTPAAPAALPAPTAPVPAPSKQLDDIREEMSGMRGDVTGMIAKAFEEVEAKRQAEQAELETARKEAEAALRASTEPTTPPASSKQLDGLREEMSGMRDDVPAMIAKCFEEAEAKRRAEQAALETDRREAKSELEAKSLTDAEEFAGRLLAKLKAMSETADV